MIKLVMEPSYMYFWNPAIKKRTYVFRNRAELVRHPTFTTTDSDVINIDKYICIDITDVYEDLVQTYAIFMQEHPEYAI